MLKKNIEKIGWQRKSVDCQPAPFHNSYNGLQIVIIIILMMIIIIIMVVFVNGILKVIFVYAVVCCVTLLPT